jgi:hypothetical protein
MFQTVPLSIVSFHCTHYNDVCHTGLLTACEQHSVSKLSANLYVLLRVQLKTHDDGQRNCPKHVEFYSKNKFFEINESSWFNIRIFHVARSPERQTDPST